jgi:cysteine-rich repeat protein
VFAQRYQICGNGGLGSAEQCDDGNEVGGDCCSAICQYESAASPCADDGLFCTGSEECDGAGSCLGDGDPCPGTACNTCQETTDDCVDPAGTDCPDEGNACTQDACDGTGTCAHDAVPATGCRTAQKSLLLLKDNDDDAKDKLLWKWVKGQPTSQTELSDPTATADYTLCVYDANGIVTSATVPARPQPNIAAHPRKEVFSKACGSFEMGARAWSPPPRSRLSIFSAAATSSPSRRGLR